MDSTALSGHDYGSVYQAIMATHSDWLRPVGGTTSLGSASKPANAPVIGIFVEGSSKPLDVDYLRELVPGNVKMIRKISASESMVTFGPDWAWGAIIITLWH